MVYVGFWLRVVALIIDSIILGIITTVIPAMTEAAADLYLLIYPLIGASYFVGFWTWRGQTPGKMAVGICVVRSDGSPIGLGIALLRYVGYHVSAILFFIGYLMIVWDGKKQGLHDKIAGTCVTKALKARVTLFAKDTPSEIIIKMPWWFRVIAWAELLLGAGFFTGYLPAILADPNSETLIPAGFGLLFILLGIWMVGMTTKVTFNQPPGYMTVTRGHIPVFLWFLRTRVVISREEARSVVVGSVQRSVGEYGGTKTAYDVMVVTTSGKEVKLYDGGWKRDKADYLAKRILEFSQR